MGYLHIANLYNDTRILEFKEVYALEKIHGSSSHIRWDPSQQKETNLSFFSGGEKHANFVNLFDEEHLQNGFSRSIGYDKVVVYGEVYGGKQQGMKNTYGEVLRFVAFDVKVDRVWLSVLEADQFVSSLGLEFVSYERISTDLDCINAERDKDSVQAIRNGIGPGKKREGVVLRPLFEASFSDGSRIIAKHKRDDFRETKSIRKVGEDQPTIEEANKVAEEFVTVMRLEHILQKLPEATGMQDSGLVIKAMVEDVLREGKGEFENTKIVRKAISSATAHLWKKRLQ